MVENKYGYTSMPIQDVMANIEEFIIPENRAIIEYLWDKNILTKQTNNYENDFSFIQLGELSEENEKLFWEFVNEYSGLDEKTDKMFTLYKGISIPITPGSEDTFEIFKPLVDLLKYQDVQKDGYMTIDEFYINYTDCYRTIDNPNYNEGPEVEDYPNIEEYIKAYNEYIKTTESLPIIKVVDESKITKSLEEYLEENGLLDCYDEEEGKIFYNRRLYEGHMKYKRSMQK